MTLPANLSTIPATIINMNPTLPGERHISFAVNKENDSTESHIILPMTDDDAIIVVDGNSTSGVVERRSTRRNWKCETKMLICLNF